MLHPLTDRQKLILDEVHSFIKSHNYPPTIPEVQTSLLIKNPGAVCKCFKALEKKGYITRIKGQHRGLDLTLEAKEHLQ
jgi:SOS-response transcriptional repressor LexA